MCLAIMAYVHTACTAHAICSTSVQFCMASHFTKLHALSLAACSNLLLTHCYAALLWRNKFQWHGTIQLASCWALLYSVFNLIIVPCISSFISSFVSVVAAKQLKKLATKMLGWNTACYVGKLCPLKLCSLKQSDKQILTIRIQWNQTY